MAAKKAARKAARKAVRPKLTRVSDSKKPKPKPVRTEVVVDCAVVREKLALSRLLHKQAQPPGPKMPRPLNWRDMLREAYDARVTALASDPNRTCPAWVEDERLTPAGYSTNDRMLAFYRSLR